MTTDDHERAVELLKQLGMKTYEAECFVALHSIPSGTARDVSEAADVPRTRVYDATASLAEQGFVEVQHTNPQRYRATPLDEAVRMLREQYEARVEELHGALETLESESTELEPTPQEVWALSTEAALDGRVAEYFDDATASVVLFLGTEDCWSSELADALQAASDRGVAVRLYAPAALADVVEGASVDAEVVDADVQWLAPEGAEAESLGRLLLVDDERLLVSTVADCDPELVEHAVVAEGETNGAVLLSRRLLGECVDGYPLPD